MVARDRVNEPVFDSTVLLTGTEDITSLNPMPDTPSFPKVRLLIIRGQGFT